jgi:hypothetical protein
MSVFFIAFSSRVKIFYPISPYASANPALQKKTQQDHWATTLRRFS